MKKVFLYSCWSISWLVGGRCCFNSCRLGYSRCCFNCI